MWGKKNGAGGMVHKSAGIENIQALMRESEAVLKATADQGGEILGEARTRLERSLRDVRDNLSDVDRAALARRARRAMQVTDEYAHGNPWPVVLVGLGLGLLAGLAFSRRR